VETTANVYIKDLRIFRNRDLKDLIIVDNAVYSFGAQLSNGVPITPFKDDKEDREFLYLMNYLMLLKDYEDMRELNREAFRMEQVYQFNLGPCVHYYTTLSDERSDDEYSDTHSNIDEEGKSTADYTDNVHNDTDSHHSKREQLALTIQASIGALGGAGAAAIYGGS
jgi:NLI interacting factor-like phosphatase